MFRLACRGRLPRSTLSARPAAAWNPDSPRPEGARVNSGCRPRSYPLPPRLFFCSRGQPTPGFAGSPEPGGGGGGGRARPPETPRQPYCSHGSESTPSDWTPPASQQPHEGLAFAHGLSCRQTQYLAKGGCCNRCPPGQKVVAACSGQSSGTCSPCEEGYFQDRWTGLPHCTIHRLCNPQAGLIVYQNGSKDRDVVCRCQEGKHCSSHECHTCRPHSLCSPGEGVQREGNHLNDTLCAPCSLGYFSNVSSSTAQCQPWSRCKEGLVQKANGTHTRDIICEAPLLKPLKAGQSPLLVLLPVAALLLGVLLFLWHRHGKCLRKRHQDLPLQEPPEPTENEEDCPAFPTQETLLGAQMGLQEKECHLAQQELV